MVPATSSNGARWIARQFPHIVGDDGLITLGDLGSIGHRALYRAARNYDPGKNPEFNAFAIFYVSGDMLDAIDALVFDQRAVQPARRLHQGTSESL